MSEWQPITILPKRKMPVLFYSTTLRLWNDNRDDISPQMSAFGRDEAFELGFFDGNEFCYNGTGHALFEFGDKPGDDPQSPTHWTPLPDPPNRDATK